MASVMESSSGAESIAVSAEQKAEKGREAVCADLSA